MSKKKIVSSDETIKRYKKITFEAGQKLARLQDAHADLIVYLVAQPLLKKHQERFGKLHNSIEQACTTPKLKALYATYLDTLYHQDPASLKVLGYGLRILQDEHPLLLTTYIEYVLEQTKYDKLMQRYGLSDAELLSLVTRIGEILFQVYLTRNKIDVDSLLSPVYNKHKKK